MNTTPDIPHPVTDTQISAAHLYHTIISLVTDLSATPFLDDVLTELTNPDFPLEWHYSVTSRSYRSPSDVPTCTGPLCRRWNIDRVREAKRYNWMRNGEARGSNIGARQPKKATVYQVGTEIIVAYLTHYGRKVPTSLIEACHVDGVTPPNTEQFTLAVARWTEMQHHHHPSNTVSRLTGGIIRPVPPLPFDTTSLFRAQGVPSAALLPTPDTANTNNSALEVQLAV